MDPFIPKMEEVANLFVKRIALMRDFQQEVNESFSEDLLKWSLTNTWMVYTRRKLSYFDDDAEVELKIESTKFFRVFNRLIETLRISETGIQLWRFMPTFTWPSLADSAHSLDRFILRSTEEAIKELNSGGPPDACSLSLVQSLLLSGELKSNDYLTQLLDVLVINSFMGAHIAGMVMYHLAKDPVAQKKALDEINRKITKESGLTSSDLDSLTYLKSCILESARLKPAIPLLSRMLKDDTTVQGYKIPKDTLIQMVNEVGLEVTSRETFLPERWERAGEGCGDPLLGLPSWSLTPGVNRSIVLQQVALLCIKMLKEFHIAHHQDPLKLDGMVLSAPTTPYNLKLIERHAKVENVNEKETRKGEEEQEEKRKDVEKDGGKE